MYAQSVVQIMLYLIHIIVGVKIVVIKVRLVNLGLRRNTRYILVTKF